MHLYFLIIIHVTYNRHNTFIFFPKTIFTENNMSVEKKINKSRATIIVR